MPLYEYRCAGCEGIFDRLSSYDAAAPECPACGGADVRRLISVIGGLGGASSPQAAPMPAAGCGGCGGGCACAN